MKRLLLSLLFTAAICNAQSKKEIFFDVDSILITKNEFLKRTDHTVNIGGTLEKNGIVINKLFTRKKIGTLSSEQYGKLKNHLKKNSSDVSDNNIIVINYYSGLDTVNPNEKSSWNIYNKSYLKKLNKTGNISQYWIYKYDENLNYHHADEINWLHDTSGFIEKTFFPFHFNAGSCVVILPNANYYIYFGE
jgi:hypothetical protein